MDAHASFDIPLETLSPGAHEFSFQLDDGFFAAFETELINRGAFGVTLEIEKVRNQYNLTVHFDGVAGVDCDRCLEPFNLPLRGEEEVVIKYDDLNPREEGEVIYVAHGTDRYNVAKLIFETIGVTLPMAIFHEEAGLTCDPAMLTYLNTEGPSDEEMRTDDASDIPADSPWAALQALKGPLNLN